MKEYYVIDNKGCDEFTCGKYAELSDAIKAARTEWDKLTANEKKTHDIEVRQYAEDIENEDCSNFEYDCFNWGYIIRDSEAGNEIEKVKTIKEAEDILWDYVKKDENEDEDEEKRLLSYEVIDTASGEALDISWDYANDKPNVL